MAASPAKKSSVKTKASTAVAPVRNITAVSVTVPGLSKVLTYKTDLEFDIGNMAVVDLPQQGYMVVRVVGVSNIVPVIATKWIVSKVDVTAYEERLQREIKLAEVRALLEKRKSALDETRLYELYAEKDEEFAKLLEQFNDLKS